MTNQAGTSVRLSISMPKESWLHVSLVVCFAAAIALLMFLDYFNLEKIAFFNDTGFMFDYTWKGRLFLFLFFWLFVLESLSGFKLLKERGIKSWSKLRLVAIFLCALIPLIYVIGINFLGLDQIVLGAGEFVRLDYWKANSIFWSNFLHGDWPLSLEYVVFTVAFVATVLLAYGKKGLRTFSISVALVAGIAVVYMIDTMYPGGAFTPFQVLALPTSACAAALLQAIGMRFSLVFSPILSSTPVISTNVNGSMISTSIAWPCAGVQSLFLYTILILLLFKRSNISLFRKSVYFVIGAVGTYSVNVLRIVTYFVLLVNQGTDAALTFHNVYGELYFFAWILLYMLLIIGIQKYSLVEKTKTAFTKIVTRRNP